MPSPPYPVNHFLGEHPRSSPWDTGPAVQWSRATRRFPVYRSPGRPRTGRGRTPPDHATPARTPPIDSNPPGANRRPRPGGTSRGAERPGATSSNGSARTTAGASAWPPGPGEPGRRSPAFNPAPVPRLATGPARPTCTEGLTQRREWEQGAKGVANSTGRTRADARFVFGACKENKRGAHAKPQR